MGLSLNIENKTVVVVGGTSGINRMIAKSFAAEGAQVAVASRSQDKVDDTVASLKSAGAKSAMGFACDVRDIDSVSQGLEKVYNDMGAFDILVSGAAGNFPAMAAEMSANAFKTVVDIDLLGTFHVMKSAYQYLAKPGCSIINISAPQAFLPYEGQSHVSAAKAGVDMITRSLSLEWGGEGVRINSVVPGFIEETEGFKRLLGNEQIKAKTLESVPMQRFGRTQDVANLCLFLGSDLASYISGQIISVDGALYQRGSGATGEHLRDLARKPRAQS